MISNSAFPSPTFTILHSCSYPPYSWYDSFHHWTSTAIDPSSIEYILIVDAERVKDLGQFDTLVKKYRKTKMVKSVVYSFRIVLNKGVPNHEKRLSNAYPEARLSTAKIAITDLSPAPANGWDLMPLENEYQLREYRVVGGFAMVGQDLLSVTKETQSLVLQENR